MLTVSSSRTPASYLLRNHAVAHRPLHSPELLWDNAALQGSTKLGCMEKMCEDPLF